MVRVRYKQSFRGVTLSCAILEDVFVCKEEKEGEKRGRKREFNTAHELKLVRKYAFLLW